MSPFTVFSLIPNIDCSPFTEVQQEVSNSKGSESPSGLEVIGN